MSIVPPWPNHLLKGLPMSNVTAHIHAETITNSHVLGLRESIGTACTPLGYKPKEKSGMGTDLRLGLLRQWIYFLRLSWQSITNGLAPTTDVLSQCLRCFKVAAFSELWKCPSLLLGSQHFSVSVILVLYWPSHWSSINNSIVIFLSKV